MDKQMLSLIHNRDEQGGSYPRYRTRHATHRRTKTIGIVSESISVVFVVDDFIAGLLPPWMEGN
jgi:hypothetical protein